MLQRLFIAFVLWLSISSLGAQEMLLSLGGTYGLVRNIRFNKILYDATGIQTGAEFKLKKRFTIGGDFDWQFFEPEPETVFYHGAPINFTIHKRQTNLRLIFRYYFNNPFQGVFVGCFGGYALIKFKNEKAPGISPYVPLGDLHQIRNDNGSCYGLLYGYRLKVTSTLKAYVSGNHQIFRNVFYPEYTQYDHQWCAGLSFVF